MDTEAPGAESTLPEHEAPRKSGRPPPIVMTSTTNSVLRQMVTEVSEAVSEDKIMFITKMALNFMKQNGS
jgi:hypothetical protein